MRNDFMRNPERIKDVMSLLTEIWQSQPDTRFNQLIHNLQSEYTGNTGRVLWQKTDYNGTISFLPETVIDLFYLEDEYFLNFLQKKVEAVNEQL